MLNYIKNFFVIFSIIVINLFLFHIHGFSSNNVLNITKISENNCCDIVFEQDGKCDEFSCCHKGNLYLENISNNFSKKDKTYKNLGKKTFDIQIFNNFGFSLINKKFLLFIKQAYFDYLIYSFYNFQIGIVKKLE